MRLSAVQRAWYVPFYRPPPPGKFEYGWKLWRVFVSVHRAVERMGVYFYNQVIHPSEIGLYNKNYNRRVHGAYHRHVWYGKPEVKLMDVKLSELVAYLGRRNWSVGAFFAEFTRQVNWYLMHHFHALFESPIRQFFRLIFFFSVLKFGYQMTVGHAFHWDTEQAEYHW